MLPFSSHAHPDRTYDRKLAGQVQNSAYLQAEIAHKIRRNGILEQHHCLPLLCKHSHCTFYFIQNILLFAFSSHQIVNFFPKLYESSKDLLLGNTEIGELFQSVTQSVTESVMNTVSNVTTAFIDSGWPVENEFASVF